MGIFRGNTPHSSLRVLCWYAAVIFTGYAVSLGVYFSRLPTAPGIALAASVLASGLLEMTVFMCVASLLLGTGSFRQNPVRGCLYAIVTLVFTLTYVAQGYALVLSNAFISPLAMENVQDATLAASGGQDLLLAISVMAWLVMLIGSWRGTPSQRLQHGGGCGLVVVASVALAGVAVFNLHAPLGGVTRLGTGQSPVASLLRVGASILQTDKAAAAALSSNAGQLLCGTQLGSGRFPFLKDEVNAQPLPFAATQAPARPNVIIVFMEGESARLFETYGGRYPGLTPNISRIARQSMVVDNYFNHTAATYRGLQGQLTSGYPLHGGAENGAGWAGGNALGLATHSYASLPALLRQRGYETVFFSPHQPAEALTPFAGMLGFDDVYTAVRSRNELLKSHDPLFNDALTDRDEYRALTSYLQQYHGSKPLLIGLYSLDTHAFLDIPPEGLPYGDGSNPSLNTLHTLDARIGAFYDDFMASKYAANTVLVLTTDHAHYAEPPYVKVAGSNYKPYFVDRIPLLIHAPWLSLPPRLDVHGRTSLDLAPTILQLLGIDRVRNSFLGHSLFDRSHDRYFSLAAIGQTIYAIYQGEVFAPGEIPAGIDKDFAACKALVQTYYTYETADAIFPANGLADRVDGSIDAASTIADGAVDASASPVPAAVLAAARTAGSCALDTMDGSVLSPGVPATIKPSRQFVAGGWVVNSERQSPVQFALLLRGTDTYRFAGGTGVPRPDVARALNAETAGSAGFNFVVRPNVPAGSYEVWTLLKGHAGDELCNTQKRFTVSP